MGLILSCLSGLTYSARKDFITQINAIVDYVKAAELITRTAVQNKPQVNCMKLLSFKLMMDLDRTP
jgi:hypothetical protein